MDEEKLVGKEILQKKILFGGSSLLVLGLVPPVPILSYTLELTLPQIAILTLVFSLFWIIAGHLIIHKIKDVTVHFIEEPELNPSINEPVSQPIPV